MIPVKTMYENHILIVDDSPDNLRLLSKIIESQGYIVRKSLSSKMAIQSAQRHPPDLILLDVNMPDMNGYEVCQILKKVESTAQIPIIFISALSQVNDKVKAFAIGAQDYITKPFQELEVLARIRNQLLIQQQRQQLEKEIRDRQMAEAEIHRLNMNLERQIQSRTLELQQSLKCEITLKRITDKVRDSLDPHQILQTAVTELAIALEADYCDAMLSRSDHESAQQYRYYAATPVACSPELAALITGIEADWQITQPQVSCSFCPCETMTTQRQIAVLTCPIFDDQVESLGSLGTLWLFRSALSSFSSMENHLVEQVANQIAIALRQAKLYAATQVQVQELEKLNQLKDDFLSTISHELRTPIASMKMVIKLLSTMMDDVDQSLQEITKSAKYGNKVFEYFRVLQEECDRELKLVEDLLSLQHIEAGNYISPPTPINLRDLIPHLAEPFETRVERQNQRLQVNVPDTLPDVCLDLRSVNRIITELLSNACKYTPAGETITISADLADDLDLTHARPFVIIAVTNAGVEIAPDQQKHIFQKFYRIPNHDPWKYGGTGLGLALVKKLVEQLGGAIEVHSAHQQTCFQVQIPVHIESLSAYQAASRASSPPFSPDLNAQLLKPNSAIA
jgi:signal transduction histidine kinase/DNA-binding response OmpR family regulator